MTHNPRQAEDKPQVVYFSANVEMAELLSLTLNRYFDVTTTLGVAQVDEALDTIRKVRPDYALVDPNAPGVAPQQLHSQIKADAELAHIQLLIISDDYQVEHYQ
jgi:CheY-like chemotaxis protein